MDRDDKFTAYGTVGLLFRLVTAVEALAAVAGEILASARSGRVFGEAAWLTVEEAAERGRFNKNHIYKLIDSKRLFVHGQAHSYRIYRKHFDEQLSRGFPELDFRSPEDGANKALESRSVVVPSPRLADAGKSLKLRLPQREQNVGGQMDGASSARRRARL